MINGKKNVMYKQLFTRKGNVQISTGYTRIVHGGRGDYIEIEPDQIIGKNITIPENQRWRLESEKCYYLWYETKDGVKIYFQKQEVNYADYKIGKYYVSPLECKGFKVGLEKWI